MTKKVLVLDGHPETQSYCRDLALQAASGAAAAGHAVKTVHLSDLAFDPNLVGRFDGTQPLEPDLENVQALLKWCDHLVLVHPLWWGSAPAKLKGLLDRILLPGYAFAYAEGKILPDGLLMGRTAQVIVTSDTPSWYMSLIYRAAWYVTLKKQILGFCGIKTVGIASVGPIHSSSEAARATWLQKAHGLGQAA